MMYKQLALAAIVSAASMGASAASVSYGWEDGGNVLGQFDSGNENMQYSNTDALAYSGSYALLVEDLDPNDGGTPQGYLAWVNGLTDGDTVTASFWVYDPAEGAAPSARIWGHYTDDAADVDSYAGSAGGNNTYSSGGWSQLSNTWTFDSDGGSRDGLMVEVRFYDSGSVPTGSLIIDDLMVMSSAGVITTPAAVPVPAAAWLFGSVLMGLGGLVRRKKS